MAALRNQITTVIIPAENEKDLEDIDPIVRSALNFVMVKQADEVLSQALANALPLQRDNASCPISEAARPAGQAVNLRQ